MLRGRRSRGVARDCEDRGGYDWRRRVIGLPMRARLHRSQDFVEKSRWQMRRLPYAWIVDDALSMFYRLVPLSHHEAPQQPTYVGERAWVQRLKERSAPKGARMFREAFVAVQRHPFITRAAVAGFLRDDGTAVCKRMDWKSDELSLYKVVLLNIDELMRLGVEYQRDLMMYEDICLTHQVLRLGGHTLKCQSFCYWAAHASSGGCQDCYTDTSENDRQNTESNRPGSENAPGHYSDTGDEDDNDHCCGCNGKLLAAGYNEGGGDGKGDGECDGDGYGADGTHEAAEEVCDSSGSEFRNEAEDAKRRPLKPVKAGTAPVAFKAGEADVDNESNDNKDNDKEFGNDNGKILEAITKMIETFDARMHGIHAGSEVSGAAVARLAAFT